MWERQQKEKRRKEVKMEKGWKKEEKRRSERDGG